MSSSHSARLLRSASWASVGAIGSAAFAAATSVLLVRTLGRIAYGDFVYWLWLGETIGVLASAGVPRLIARQVAVDGRSQREVLMLALGAAGLAVLLAFGLAGSPLGSGLVLPTFLAGYAMAIALQYSTAAALQAAGRFRILSFAALIQTFASFIGASMVAVGYASLETQLRVVVLASIAMAISQVGACLAAPRTSAMAIDHALFRNWHVFAGLTLIELIVWQRPEIYFLRTFAAEGEVGVYGAALAVAGRLGILGQIALPVLFAEFAREAASGSERGRRVYEAATTSIAALGLPVFAAVAIFGTRIMCTVFGGEYETGGAVLAILATAGFVALCSVPGSAVIYARTGVGRVFFVGLIAAAMTLAADFLLAGPFGAVGAAIGNSVGQFVAVAGSTWWILRADGFRFPLRRVLSMLGVASFVGAAAWLATKSLGSPLDLAAGLLTFWVLLAIVARILRPLRSEEIDALGLSEPGRVGHVLAFFSR